LPTFVAPLPRPREPGPVAALPVPGGAEGSVGLLRAMPPG
jgi:hypothetical protein